MQYKYICLCLFSLSADGCEFYLYFLCSFLFIFIVYSSPYSEYTEIYLFSPFFKEMWVVSNWSPLGTILP